MTVLVAGATRGLGLAITQVCLERGHKAVASMRGAAPKLEELSAEHGDRLEIVTFDVADEDAIRTESQRLANAGVRLTHIVNNAGVLMGRGDSAARVSKDELIRSFEIQTVGPAMVVKHFLTLLDPGSGVQILNVSSDSGSIAGVNRLDYPYSLSKCALNMYTAMLRMELEPKAIEVAAIHPGWIHTDMGGPKAPGDPYKAAETILDLLSGEQSPPSGHWFFDIDLKPMEW